MSKNGIAWLSTKQERQKAKLDLAASNRSADGYARKYYDITQLPTQYNGNGITNNPNTGGLIVGRPWVSTPPYTAGIYRSLYSGWPNQNTANPSWFDSATSTGSVVANNFDAVPGGTSTAYQWLGYFKPDYTGTWTISTNSSNIDDCVTVWIGNTALTGYTTGNALLNISLTSGFNTISLTSGTYYPIRVQYANNAGPGYCTLAWSHPGATTPSATWTGKLFYNTVTNGF